ncbi:MAG: ComEC/Rec2 family competence protein, partial [Pseudomonadota bacterium]
AVAVIFYLRHMFPDLNNWRMAVLVQCVLAPAMGILAAYWYGGLGWLSPIVNLIAVPILGIWLAPLSLTAALLPPLEELCWSLASLPVHGFLWLDKHIAPSLSPWMPYRPSLPVAISALLGLLWFANHRAIGHRLLAVPLLAIALMPASLPLPVGRTEITLLDVGQGLSLILRRRNFTLVYDTGDGDPQGFNMASAVIQPYLERQGVEHIDLLVISHGDRDHASGVSVLRERFSLGEVWIGEPYLASAPEAKRCRAGQRHRYGDLTIDTLAPWTPDVSGNNSSCVLLLSVDGYRVLLPGDIESEIEYGLIRRHRNQLDVDLLLAPHHGSGSSTSSALLNATTPDLVLLSRGYRNRFGHPDPAVMRRLRAFGAVICDTAEQGAVMIRLENGKISQLDRWRDATPRYWQALASPACDPAYNAR